MRSILKCYREYATFDGRATRTEYWLFTLFVLAVFCVLLGLELSLRTNSVLLLVALAFILGSLLPSVAVMARRLHDVGQSGWWAGAISVPGINLVLLGYMMLKSAPDNEYGPRPGRRPAALVESDPAVRG